MNVCDKKLQFQIVIQSLDYTIWKPKMTMLWISWQLKGYYVQNNFAFRNDATDSE